MNVLRATKSGAVSPQPLVDLSPSTYSYFTTSLEAGTEYQFQLKAFVNKIQTASSCVNVTTEPTGK